MIGINADTGEDPRRLADGSEERLLDWLTEVNIACGGHAGNEETMAASVAAARRRGLRIGAHPGYEDRENFGRLPMELSSVEVERLVERQVRALERHAPELTHVKPHGALYNQAAKDARLAAAIAAGVARFSRSVTLVGLAGSVMLDAFAEAGFRVAAEAFADRGYSEDGTLVPRTAPGALITDPALAAAQALRLAGTGSVQTICIHSDTPGAEAIARAVAQALLR